jgi:non-canonical (house-cleaning) NTP pyrophosphatase
MSGATVRVGSENRAKLGAVEAALRPFLRPDCEPAIVAVAVDSGVAEQPIGWDEIVCGARNRARAALASGGCALAIGLEDGLVRLSDPASDDPRGPDASEVYNVGCAWVTDGEREAHGFSSGFAYPPACRDPAFRDRSPIGELFDRLWRAHRSPAGASAPAESVPSGRQGGNIGLLTQGRLDRSAYGAQAIVCALVPFLHTDLYD